MYTLREFCGFLDVPSETRCREVALGLTLARFVEKRPTASNCLSWHVDQIYQALDENRLELYFDAYGRWVGSLYWKYLDVHVEAAVRAGTDPFDLASKDSGEPWIAYFEAIKTNLLPLLRRAAAVGPLSFIDRVAYARIRNGRRVHRRAHIPARIGSAATAPSSAEDFLAKDRGGKQLCEALEMLSKARRLGEWALLSSASQTGGRQNLVNFVNCVTVPLLLGQYLEVRTLDDELEAFLAYGLLTEEGLARFRLKGSSALCPACYSEGDVVTAICAGTVSSRAAQVSLAAQATALHGDARRELKGTGVLALDSV